MVQSSRPEDKSKQASNLQLRVVSAIVLGAVVLGVTYLGGLPFRLLCGAMAIAVFYEWVTMRRAPAAQAHLAVSVVLLGAVLAALVAGLSAFISFTLLAIAAVLCCLHGVLSGKGLSLTAGLAYAAAPALALAYLRNADQAGLMAVLFLFAVVWATDIMAYFTGRLIGGPKLAPSISPGKTWSGALGGAFFAILAGLFVASFGGGIAGLPIMAAVALLLSVISQSGDLLESALKRHHGVKDSGKLIPGHGGVMDRVDGLVVAALGLYVIGALLVGPDIPAHGFFAP